MKISEVMPSIYLIRHGETAMNASRLEPGAVIGGHSPFVDINARGEEQSRILGRYLLARGIMPTQVYRSDTLRTQRTSHLCLDEMNSAYADVVVVPELNEMSQGDWEGRSRNIYRRLGVQAAIKHLQKDFSPPNGESMRQAGERLAGWIDSSVSIDTDSVYFLFTHGMLISCVLSEMLGWTREQTFASVPPNGSYTVLQPVRGRWCVTDDGIGLVPKIR